MFVIDFGTSRTLGVALHGIAVSVSLRTRKAAAELSLNVHRRCDVAYVCEISTVSILLLFLLDVFFLLRLSGPVS